MIRSYFKIAWRNLLRYKVLSGINIIGLATGLASSLLLLIFVFHEFSYDRFHVEAKRIYRIAFQLTADNQVFHASLLSARFGPALAEATPEIEKTVRLCTRDHVLVKAENKQDVFYEDKVVFADSTFLSVFSFPLQTGNSDIALTKPFSLVISKAMALKYFGDDNPIGKHLVINNQYSFEVTGVFAPLPSNSSLDFTCVGSLNSFAQMEKERGNFTKAQVGMGGYQTYVLLNSPLQAPKVSKQVNSFYEGLQTNKNNQPQFYLESLPDIYFYSKIPTLKTATDINYLYIFLAIALLILAISLINYVNLTTAYATTRAREIGLRKVFGAAPRQITWQILSESALISLIAFILALLLTRAGLTVLNQMMQINLTLSYLLQPSMLFLLLGILLAVILLSGSYPAFILTQYRPIQMLKNGLIVVKKGFPIRQVLLLFQLSISVILITSSIVIQTQLDYIQHKKIGLQQEQILVIPLTATYSTNKLFKEQTKRQAGVMNATLSDGIPSKNNWMLPIKPPLLKQEVWLTFFAVDEDFINTMGMQLTNATPSGKGFSASMPKVILNQTAIKQLQLQASIGKQIPLIDNQSTEIVGIIKDFNYESLHKSIAPLGLIPINESQKGGYLSIRVDKQVDLSGLLTTVKKLHNQYSSGHPFNYFFLNDSFDKLYKAEDRLANIFLSFTGLSILITCLGLFGLIIFIAEQRTKEISVRKVLGASIFSIVTLFYVDFLKLTLIALTIAAPFIWLGMNRWLQTFAYKISLEWWMFLLSGGLLIGFSLLAISYHSIKAALMNPIKSLQSK
jgi:putative ABC transport system permease protein